MGGFSDYIDKDYISIAIFFIIQFSNISKFREIQFYPLRQ
jgi:hypothetical protein